ncbi:hydrolase/acyltransferase [Ferviditalea candida]|uniref:Hydrolase/acyltransferase n=1 Tax=Ferviditalea candida TaxID=3108399 RepID=A0ABU5ZQQ2_9BACL|nr:hydrolase/acyltransferase [Paenibacillaceae bacterium T2]
MSNMRYVILQNADNLEFVQIPASHAYQLTALHHRLHKEIGKLAADSAPELPHAVAECDNLEITVGAYAITSSLDYINDLEKSFAAIEDKSYPVISLLTEIRALQAQLEQWYEEEA